jgi:hypothetical protein
MQILISQALRRPSVSVRIASHLFFEAKEEVKKHGMGYVIRRQSRAADANVPPQVGRTVRYNLTLYISKKCWSCKLNRDFRSRFFSTVTVRLR